MHRCSLDIDEASIRTLNPRNMLNDTVIDFYMNYLLEKEFKTQKDKIHIFNTFFFKHLQSGSTNNDDSQKRSWESKAKLFDKDFLVVPICDHLHWLMIIICYPRLVPAHDDPIMISVTGSVPINPSQSKVPCMMIFNSLNLLCQNFSMACYSDPLRNFLCNRWKKERKNEELPLFKDKLVFRVIKCLVPSQRNSFDCGIHVLSYFEKFFQDVNSSCSKILCNEDLTLSWHVDTSEMREKIRAILMNSKRDCEDKSNCENNMIS